MAKRSVGKWNGNGREALPYYCCGKTALGTTFSVIRRKKWLLVPAGIYSLFTDSSETAVQRAKFVLLPTADQNTSRVRVVAHRKRKPRHPKRGKADSAPLLEGGHRTAGSPRSSRKAAAHSFVACG